MSIIRLLGVFALLTPLVSGCGGGNSDSSGIAPPSTIPDGARLLAAQCFQCHGTNGQSKTGIESISGENYGELLNELREMQNNSSNNIMHSQIRGYNDSQLQAISAYLSTLPRGNNNDD